MAAPSYQGDPTAVLGRRFGAYVIDGIIATVLLLAIGIPMLRGAAEVVDHSSDVAASETCRVINRNTFDADRDGQVDENVDGEITFGSDDPVCVPVGSTTYTFTGDDIVSLYLRFFGLNIVLGLVLNVLIPGLAGGSPGKLAVGLRVVRADGRTAGIGYSALRALLWIVDGLCLIGVITVCVSKGHRRVGDMAAGTFVVRKDQVGRPVNVPGLTSSGYQVPTYPTAYAAGSWPQPGQSAPGAWAPPADATATHQAAAPATATPGTEGPTWDAARNAYIQWDPAQSSWVQWDDATGTWTPIR